MVRWRVHLFGALLTLGGLLGAPVALHTLAYLDHEASYDGRCGPHAPDIAAHDCTREEHMAEFDAGFAGVGLLLIEFVVGAGCGLLAVVAWLVAAIWLSRRSRAGASELG